MMTTDGSFRLLRALVGLFTLLLMGVTWPLWTEAPSATSPQIPWFGVLTNVPFAVDQVALGATVIASIWMMTLLRKTAPWQETASAWLYWLGLACLASLDQHRMQPWVIQYLLFATLLLIARDGPFLRSWKYAIAAVYIWSAISKLDASFFSQHGQLLLNGILDPLGIDHAFWADQTKRRIAMLFPVGELAVGILLLVPKFRRFGLPLSVGMHLALIGILAFGLKHEWGVLLWNPFFILQNLIVFGPDCFRRNCVPQLVPKLWGATAFTLLVMSYPALELAGRCDHWPAWGVYCARPAQVRVLIVDSETHNLPDELRKHQGLPAPLDDRLPLSLDSWCFQKRVSPTYPQERYRLALAIALLKDQVPDSAVTVEVRSTPNRWTGERTLKVLNGLNEVETACKNFHFNTASRR